MLTIWLALLIAGTATTTAGAQVPTAAPAPFFGLGAEHGNVSAERRGNDLTLQAMTGVAVMRENIRWDEIERSAGKFDYSKLDAIVRDMAARKLAMLPTLVYAPDFYTSKPASGSGSNQYPPKDPATLANFATKLVKRYGPRGSIWCRQIPLGSMLQPQKGCIKKYAAITTWQIWNEPNYPSWWGGKPDAAQYGNLLKIVSTAIHKADRGARVMAAGLTNKAVSSGYLDQFYASGAAKSADVMALHPYGKTVSSVIDFTLEMRDAMYRLGDGKKPLALTEYGWADGGSRSDFIVSTNCQAALVYAVTRRLSDLRLELGIDSIYDFYWNDQPAKPKSAWPYFAGMVRTDGSPKPVLRAFTAAVKGTAAPDGLTLAAACPADRQSTT